MYWDASSKTYIPVPGGSSAEIHPGTMTALDQAILSNPAADAPLDMKKPAPLDAASPTPVPVCADSAAPEPVPTCTEKKDDDDAKRDKDDKPRSLAAVKVDLQEQEHAKLRRVQNGGLQTEIQMCKSENVAVYR